MAYCLVFLTYDKAPEKTTTMKKVAEHKSCDHHQMPYIYFT